MPDSAEVLSIVIALASLYYARKQANPTRIISPDEQSLIDEFAKIQYDITFRPRNPQLFDNPLFHRILSAWNAWVGRDIRKLSREKLKLLFASICISEFQESVEAYDPVSERQIMERLLKIEDRNKISPFLKDAADYLYTAADPIIRLSKPERFHRPIHIAAPVTYLTEHAMVEYANSRNLLDAHSDFQYTSTVEQVNRGNFSADIVFGADASIDPLLQSGNYQILGMYGRLTNRILKSSLIIESPKRTLDGDYLTIYGEHSSAFHHLKELSKIFGGSTIRIQNSIELTQLMLHLEGTTSSGAVSVWSPYWKMLSISGMATVVPSALDAIRYLNNVCLVKRSLLTGGEESEAAKIKKILDYSFIQLRNKATQLELATSLAGREAFLGMLLSSIGLAK